MEVLKLLRKYRQEVPTTGTIESSFGSVALCLTECGLSRTQATSPRAAIYRCALRLDHPSPTIPFLLFPMGSRAMSESALPSTSTSHYKFAPMFNIALVKYKRKTKQDLTKHPLLPRFQSCDSPEAILTVLREQTPESESNQSQNSDDGFTKWVTPTVNVLYSFSAALGGVFGLVNITIFFRMILSNLRFTFQAFPPANIIFTGIGVLLLVRVFHGSFARLI